MVCNHREWSGYEKSMLAHHFTSAMQADVIHLMVDGRVIESGNHAELLASGGRYAQSWRQQQMREAGRRRGG